MSLFLRPLRDSHATVLDPPPRLLLDTPAAVRFISAEPLLGPVDLEHIAHENGCAEHYYAALSGYVIDGSQSQTNKIDWVIIGGESGPSARPFDLRWARSIIARCKAAGVACFVKQLGSAPHSIEDRISHRGDPLPTPNGFCRYLNHNKGGDMTEFPADLRVRQYPNQQREAA